MLDQSNHQKLWGQSFQAQAMGAVWLSDNLSGTLIGPTLLVEGVNWVKLQWREIASLPAALVR